MALRARLSSESHAASVSRGDGLAQSEALLFLAELECRAGEWSRADEYAEEMLQSGEQQGLEFQGGSALWIRGLVDAYLGRLDQARARATEGVSRSREENEQAFLERNLALLGFIDLSTRDYGAAAAQLAPVVRRRQARGAGEPSLYPARELAIEALVGGRRPRRGPCPARVARGSRSPARHPLAACDGRALPGSPPGGRGGPRSGARKLRAGACRARAHAFPFERARTLLIYGTILRRAKRRKPAREAIEAALSIFEAFPAPVWAENARAEMSRIGGRAPSGDGLTESERRIAEQVAAGKSNKEAAAALFVSVHTVEGVLTAGLPEAGSAVADRALTSPRRRPVEQRPPIPRLSRGRGWSQPGAMPEYLVELYSVATPDPAALDRLGEASAIRYVRSILIPGDETCLHLVEADSAGEVAEAFDRAGLQPDRIVEAIGMQTPTAIDKQRRKI